MKSLTALALGLTALTGQALAAETPLDTTPRIAVMSAFAPEWQALLAATTDQKSYEINGNTFVTGTLSGKPVVLFLSGVSMVNAAMSTQQAIDRFELTAIVFSGIAGGVDPALSIGDVVVPAAWGQYLEATFAREVDGKFAPPSFMSTPFPNYGMIFPGNVGVFKSGADKPEERFWFEADAKLLEVAKAVAGSVTLDACTPEKACLSKPPKVVVGGNGVSGQAFVDNAAFRDYARATFKAEVLDMESAATAHVAYANGVPFIAFRSLSDLAGGGEGENEMGTFFALASTNSARVVESFLKALP